MIAPELFRVTPVVSVVASVSRFSVAFGVLIPLTATLLMVALPIDAVTTAGSLASWLASAFARYQT